MKTRLNEKKILKQLNELKKLVLNDSKSREDIVLFMDMLQRNTKEKLGDTGFIYDISLNKNDEIEIKFGADLNPRHKNRYVKLLIDMVSDNGFEFNVQYDKGNNKVVIW